MVGTIAHSIYANILTIVCTKQSGDTLFEMQKKTIDIISMQ